MLNVSLSYGQHRKNAPVRPHTDTIQVCLAKTTYLAFPSAIELVDLGNKDFTFKVEKNILLLKCKPGARNTNMLIKFGQELFTASLMYAEVPPRSLYDFRKRDFDSQDNGTWERSSAQDTPGKSPEPVQGATALSPQAYKNGDSPVPDKRIAAVHALEPHFKTYGVIKNSISFLLENLVSDDKYIYLQLSVSNKSRLNYILDYVSFEYKRPGNLFPPKVFEPVSTPADNTVPAHSRQVLVYVIPLFASSEKGEFTITFRETAGNRKAILRIPSRAVQSALVFSHDQIQ